MFGGVNGYVDLLLLVRGRCIAFGLRQINLKGGKPGVGGGDHEENQDHQQHVDHRNQVDFRFFPCASSLKIHNYPLQDMEKRYERWQNKARDGERAAALTRWGVTLWRGKCGQLLLPQPAGFASNVSQKRFTLR